ncbi:hypothetical protein HaLaN_06419 [Haematococcus lacustris]|uniref:Uncharacterized protein n=1 Tax=Haematococcus lacustris TaxID=44745 RepID=A0A699YTD3_HAELA|nr:hypothetical protein HaLaN_06419 [Haematococcus lacustris]
MPACMPAFCRCSPSPPPKSGPPAFNPSLQPGPRSQVVAQHSAAAATPASSVLRDELRGRILASHAYAAPLHSTSAVTPPLSTCPLTPCTCHQACDCQGHVGAGAVQLEHGGSGLDEGRHLAHPGRLGHAVAYGGQGGAATASPPPPLTPHSLGVLGWAGLPALACPALPASASLPGLPGLAALGLAAGVTTGAGRASCPEGDATGQQQCPAGGLGRAGEAGGRAGDCPASGLAGRDRKVGHALSGGPAWAWAWVG